MKQTIKGLWLVISALALVSIFNILFEAHHYKTLDERITNIEMAK